MDLKTARLLITATSYAKGDPELRRETDQSVGRVIYNTTGRPLVSAELVKLLPDMDGYIAGVDVIDRAALQAADKLKVIARYGAGVDNVDLQAAQEKGIVVTNTPGANSVSVAELTIAFMLSLARPLVDAVAATRQGSWPRLMGLSLEGKTIGLIGLGSIGKHVVRRLVGFDCRILAHDPWADRGFAAEHRVELVELDALLREADFVSLHVPLTAETRGLVDESFLAKIKPGACLINTARGELIDEAALLQALHSGHLRGAALDVFAKEPPGADHPFMAMPQVIVTPHMGAHTDGAVRNMGWTAYEECLRVLRGEAPLHRVV